MQQQSSGVLDQQQNGSATADTELRSRELVTNATVSALSIIIH